jgi:hypothetical protein
METPFPTFEQSGFYRSWLQAELAGIGTRQQSAHCLELARYIYEETRKDRAADREGPALPGAPSQTMSVASNVR